MPATTDRERYARAKRIFQDALEQAAAQRAAFVDAACAGDDVLRGEVEALLAAFADADTGLLAGREAAAVDPATLGLDRGWRVLRELARGGMGVVYLVERADGAYDQRAALKLIAPAALDPEAIARLRFERQILARLEHPNIARLLDGGNAADGRPYLVMEYVDGERLDVWCRQHQAGIEERLQLFLAICAAVAYAHRHLVVHRDLKPGNILVGADGVPKLLDFGIAKRLSAEATLTGDGARLLTPRYASPEQIRGEPVTTLSDVYALGVILYELLADASPYGDAVSTPLELPRAICEEEPSRPSAGVAAGAAAATRAARARRARRLRGDLDAITLKALRKAPAERYESVEALAADVRAHLAGLPVTARRGEHAYRARKFMRRHWPALTTALGVVALTVAFLLGLQRQLHATAVERDKAARVAQFMTQLFRVADPSESRGNTVTVREVLDRGARNLGADRSLDAAVRSSLLQTVGKVYRQLGLYAEAGPLLATALADAAQADAATRAAARVELAALHIERGAYAKAEALLAEADTISSAAATDPLGLRSRIRYHQGEAALRQARIDAARGLIEESLALRLRAFGDPSREAAESLVALGGIARDRGEPEQAEAHFRRALAMIDATGADPWQRARLVNNLAVTAGDRGDLEGAEARFREALALMREVLGDEHPTLAAAYGNVASMLSRRGDFVAAGPLLERALALREKHLGAGHPMTGTSLANLGYNDYARGDFAAARTRLERALAIQRQGFGPSHLHTLSTLRNLVVVRLAQGEPAAALAFADELLASDPTSIGVEHPLRLQALLRREVLRCLGERCDARALNDALERQRAKQGANHPEVLESSALAALALRRAGDADGACREAGRAHAALQGMVSETHWERALAAWTLSGCAGADAAAAARGRALLVARLGADHPLLATPPAPR